MKILLAIDGSDDSKAAARSIANRVLAPATEVHVITAYDKAYVPATTPGTIGTVEFHEATNDPEAKTANDLTTWAAQMISAAHPDALVTTAAIDGDPKEVIPEEAKRFEADLVVLGSKGHNMLGRLLLGSVSKYVSEHAPCSVEIVR